MDYEKLIERLNNHLQSLTAYSDPELAHTLGDAATFLSALQAENKRLKSLLSEGGQDLWSKENQLAREVKRLQAENEKLRAELEQVKHQRDSYRMYHDDLVSKPNCNTCADKDCKYRPIPGDTVRANCPLWRGSEEGEQDG